MPRIVCLLISIASAAGPVSAQETGRADGPRAVHLEAGTRVHITLHEGDRVEGAVAASGSDVISVRLNGHVRDIPMAAVATIERDGDSIGNGALIGALVLGAWCAYICGQLSGGDADRWGQFAGGALGGALVGIGIDLLITGRTTVYESRQAPKAGAAVVRFTMTF